MTARYRLSLDDRAAAVLPLSAAVLQILLSLSAEPRHGLGIAADVKAFTEGRTVLGPGTLYGTIKRMLDLGLVEDVADRPRGEEDDPRRRYYRITLLGRRALELETQGLASLLNTAQRRRILKRT